LPVVTQAPTLDELAANISEAISLHLEGEDLGRTGLFQRSNYFGHHGTTSRRLMSKLRVLSGGDLVRVFARFGFTQISQRGSHAKLRRVLPNGTRENLTAVSDALRPARINTVVRP
jgi:hypothetical protein